MRLFTILTTMAFFSVVRLQTRKVDEAFHGDLG